MINWVDIRNKVPCDRKEVLVFGTVNSFGFIRTPKFLGVSKYNVCRDGVGAFDIERVGRFSVAEVTHWAAINNPTNQEN